MLTSTGPASRQRLYSLFVARVEIRRSLSFLLIVNAPIGVSPFKYLRDSPFSLSSLIVFHLFFLLIFDPFTEI